MNLVSARRTGLGSSSGWWPALAVALVVGVPGAAGAWQLDCTRKPCRILGYTDVRHEFGSPRIALVVTKQGDVVVTALYTRAEHSEFFNSKPPTFARFDDEDFVPDPGYFDDRLPATLSVDAAVSWTLFKRTAAQYQASGKDAPKIVDTLARGNSATVTYAASFWGEGQRATISLEGFKEVLESLEIVRPPSPERTVADPVSVVRRLIGRNDFGVTPDDLRSKPNPRGEGEFVYVSQVRIGQGDQEFLWFVKGGMAVTLTQVTRDLTPSLKHPREASPNFWGETGLSEGTVRLEGLKTAFGE